MNNNLNKHPGKIRTVCTACCLDIVTLVMLMFTAHSPRSYLMVVMAVIVTIHQSTSFYLQSLCGASIHKRTSNKYSNTDLKYSSKLLLAMTSTDKIEDDLKVTIDIVDKAALSLQKYFFSVDLKTKSTNLIMLVITFPLFSVVTLLYSFYRYDD